MNYKFCPKCGVKNEGYNFCPSCGAHFETGTANLTNNGNFDQLNPDLIWDRLDMCHTTVPDDGFDVHGVGPDFWDNDIDPLSPEMTLLQSNLFFRKGEIEIMKSNPKHDVYKDFKIAQITERSLYFGDMVNGLPHGHGFIFYKINHDSPDKPMDVMIRNLRTIECNQYFDNFDLILEYCGQFKNGLKDGRGVLYNTTYATISYKGCFVNDLYHGYGTNYLSGKEHEFGEFRNGQMFERVTGRDQFGNNIFYLDDEDEEDEDNEL